MSKRKRFRINKRLWLRPLNSQTGNQTSMHYYVEAVIGDKDYPPYIHGELSIRDCSETINLELYSGTDARWRENMNIIRELITNLQAVEQAMLKARHVCINDSPKGAKKWRKR